LHCDAEKVLSSTLHDLYKKPRACKGRGAFYLVSAYFLKAARPEPGHPHHGKHLVLWNFQHSSTMDFNYNFWDMQRRGNFTIAYPILVGFRADKHITFENAGVNERPGQAVLPESLFEAQLQYRLTGKNLAARK
jgi:hypothetical protein